MAKTIKELSTDYAFYNCNKENEFFLVEEAYQVGAKAVLEKTYREENSHINSIFIVPIYRRGIEDTLKTIQEGGKDETKNSKKNM